MLDLEERVRAQLFAEAPQENAEEYVNDRLERMTAAELLHVLSYTFNWDGIPDP